MNYRVVLAHKDQERFATEVEKAVSDAARDLGAVADSLEVSSSLSDDGIPQVVAYLATEAGRDDKEVIKVIGAALALGVAILPVEKAEGTGRVADSLPERLKRLNAVSWQGDGVGVANSLLRMLGLVEAERKVFISYRQSETRELATQLHTALVQRGFDVFLDRFSVDPGVNFQRRLEEDLGDKAFVLLLESNGLEGSKWVRHEIAYAHARRIEILALTLPDCTNRVQAIDNAFRFPLAEGDVSSEGTLFPGALGRALDAVEMAHARALRRRREQILGSVTQKLEGEGCECEPTDDWCVFATRQGTGDSGLFWVTPRRPAAKDFYGLSLQHNRVAGAESLANLKGAVVHDAGRLADDYRELIGWLSHLSGSELATVGTCSL